MTPSQEDSRAERQKLNPREVLSDLHTDLQLEIIDHPESLRIADVAKLDKDLFGEHKALSEGEFRDIVSKGGILVCHKDGEDKIVSESTLVMISDSDNGASPLERNLPSWLGYCDGAAVSREFRGKGLQKELLTAREILSKAYGKEATSASVRHRNLASIRSMLKNGYVMVDDAPGYYGSEKTDDRVVMLKLLDAENPLANLTIDHDALDIDAQGITSDSDVHAKIRERSDVVALATDQSDDVNEGYNASLAQLLRAGYVGVSCHDFDIGDSDGEASNVMIFVRLSSMGELGERYRQKQSELQTILDN